MMATEYYDFYTNERKEGVYSTFDTTGSKRIKVFYISDQDGGGTTFGQDYIPMLQEKYPGRVFDRAYEWCSGPGFIGYNILSHGICKTLCLSDLYDPSITSAEITANYEENQCKELITTYLCKDVALIPLYEQFDLVVSNPPHFNPYLFDRQTNNYGTMRIAIDLNWQTHQNFFNNIKQHLTPNGIILLQENSEGSTAEVFRPMIESNGMRITNCYTNATFDQNKMYYLEIQHA